MDVADHLRLLVAYDGWATERLLQQTTGLVEEGIPPGASWGSIEGSLRHVLDSHATWLARFTGEERRGVEGEGFAGIATTAAAIHERLTAFVAALTEPAAYEEVHFQDSRGAPHHDHLLVLLSHLVNHGTYHRGEAAMLLTGIGRSPGDLDLVVYRRLVEPGR